MPSDRGLRHYLRHGGVIAYATESCFGLGCNPSSRLGVQRILRLKGRPQHKGLILIASQLHQSEPYLAKLSAEQQATILSPRPRPHTWLAPAAKHCPRWLSGRHRSLAVRLTSFPPAKALCESAGMALVSTSANRSGCHPATTTRDCRKLFGAQVRVIAGRIGKQRRPSTIQDLVTGKILRA